jgi:hypothetical protein
VLKLVLAGLGAVRLGGYRVLADSAGNAKWELKCTKTGVAAAVLIDDRADRNYALAARSYAEFALGRVSDEFDTVEFTNKSGASLSFRLQLLLV